MNYSVPNTNQILNSCIEINESHIHRRLTIPNQIVFRLNADLLQQIESLKAKDQQFQLEAAKLANLRYYTLINSPLEIQSNAANYWQSKFTSIERSSLSFSTNYLLSEQQYLTVIRSSISLEGYIAQQIQQNLWDNPQLCQRLLNAHYWLMEQILRQLPLKTSNNLFWVLKIIIFIIWAIALLTFWNFLPLPNLPKISIICCLFYLNQNYLIPHIKQPGKILLITALFNNYLINNTFKRQIALKIVQILFKYS
ncbi:hypothetical protein NIES4102_27630 [Chondrocystis sp. NIES-4102]|nr:hypothetical protein NIES4102_27630 [Chondrocystis sp. NIES-4102]